MKQMMKKYLYMAAVAVVGTGFLMSSCKDEFAGQNTNPSTVSNRTYAYVYSMYGFSAGRLSPGGLLVSMQCLPGCSQLPQEVETRAN